MLRDVELSTKGTAVTRTSHKRRAALLAAPAVAAGLLLAGCQQTPGTAAFIGGDRVKVSQVQSSTTRFLDLVPNQYSEGDVQLLVLERDIYSRILARAAGNVGVSATATEVARDRVAVFAATGGRDGLVKRLAAQQQPEVVAPDQVEQWLRDRILFQKLAAASGGGDASSGAAQQAVGAELTKAAKQLKIKVSPRYGVWSDDRGLTPGLSGGLSRTPQELAGTASPTPVPAQP